MTSPPQTSIPPALVHTPPYVKPIRSWWMAPRSSLLGFGQVVGPGWHDIYVGPTGWTSLVKELTLHSSAGTAGAVTLWLASAGRSAAIWSVGAAVPGIYVYPSDLTIPPASNLTLQLVTAITLNVAISGAVLEGVPPFAPQAPTFRVDLG